MRGEKTGKSVEEIEDEEAAKRAKEILDAVGESEKIMYRELFNFFDVDKDRTWGSIEFAQRMTDIGFATSVEEASNLLYFAGVRDVDRITYNDFLAMMPKLRAFRVMIENEAMAAFASWDPGYGWLTPKLCKNAFRDIDPTMDPKQINQLVKKADRLKDGIITYDFFIRAMFDDTPPLTKYIPRRRHHPVVQALLTVITCGGWKQQ